MTLTHKSSAVERRQQASRGPTTADHRTYRQMRLKRTSYDPRRLPCKMYAHWLLTRIPLDRRGARRVRSLKPLSRLCSVCSPLLRNTANTPPCSQLSRQSHRLYSLSAQRPAPSFTRSPGKRGVAAQPCIVRRTPSPLSAPPTPVPSPGPGPHGSCAVQPQLHPPRQVKPQTKNPPPPPYPCVVSEWNAAYTPPRCVVVTVRSPAHPITAIVCATVLPVPLQGDNGAQQGPPQRT